MRKSIQILLLLSILPCSAALGESAFTFGETDQLSTTTNSVNCDFSYLKHNDIRYIMKHDSSEPCHLKGTASVIHRFTLEHTDKLLGIESNITYPENGAVGPENGEYSEDGKEYYLTASQKLDNQRSRQNIIFSVDVENAQDISPNNEIDQVYKLSLIVFAHSDESLKLEDETEVSGYFFRRIEAIYDTRKPKGFTRISLNHKAVIPLGKTNFVAKSSLKGKKFILHDSINNIIKVFPITVGGFDVRSGIDGVVDSMTFQVPQAMYKNARRNKPNQTELHKEYQTFTNAYLTKTSENPHSRWNTEFRTHPSGFRGRPYIAFVDEGLKDISSDVEYVRFGYRLIATHYKMISKLTRSDSSHGCERMEDKNLYQLFAILEYGPTSKIPIEVQYELEPPFNKIDNMMPVKNVYKQVRYTTKDIKRSTFCENGSSYSKRAYTSPTGDLFYTFADSGCGSSMKPMIGSSSSIYDYLINAENAETPKAIILSDGDHYPERWSRAVNILISSELTEEKLKQIVRVRAANQNKRQIDVLEAMAANKMPGLINGVEDKMTATWPEFDRPPETVSDEVRDYMTAYKRHCRENEVNNKDQFYTYCNDLHTWLKPRLNESK